MPHLLKELELSLLLMELLDDAMPLFIRQLLRIKGKGQGEKI